MADWTSPTARITRVEDEAERLTHDQQIAEGAWLRLMERTRQDAEHVLDDMVLGVQICGYDKAGILAILDDWQNLQRDPDEDLRAIELAEEREP